MSAVLPRVMRRVEPSRRLMDASRPLHDPSFEYRDSDNTDIEDSFARERQRLADEYQRDVLAEHASQRIPESD